MPGHGLGVEAGAAVVDDIIADETLRAQHIQAIVTIVQDNGLDMRSLTLVACVSLAALLLVSLYSDSAYIWDEPFASKPWAALIGVAFIGAAFLSSILRNRKLAEKFSRLGLILSLIKWNPDAIWSLSSSRMALHP